VEWRAAKRSSAILTKKDNLLRGRVHRRNRPIEERQIFTQSPEVGGGNLNKGRNFCRENKGIRLCKKVILLEDKYKKNREGRDDQKIPASLKRLRSSLKMIESSINRRGSSDRGTTETKAAELGGTNKGKCRRRKASPRNRRIRRDIVHEIRVKVEARSSFHERMNQAKKPQ